MGCLYCFQASKEAASARRHGRCWRRSSLRAAVAHSLVSNAALLLFTSRLRRQPTVQHECIPQAILGMDVICQAKSGMGKTAVFVISVLQQLETSNSGIGALIMCHTRELAYQVGANCTLSAPFFMLLDKHFIAALTTVSAAQISHEFERFCAYLPDVNVAVIYGGVDVNEQKKSLKAKPPHIVVGTPGRVKAVRFQI